MAPQSTMTNGLARRALSWCTVCASISLPVPLSPVMSTVVSVAATRRVRLSRSFIADDWNTNWLCCKRRAQVLDLGLQPPALVLGAHAVQVGQVLAIEGHGQLRGHAGEHRQVGLVEVERLGRTDQRRACRARGRR